MRLVFLLIFSSGLHKVSSNVMIGGLYSLLFESRIKDMYFCYIANCIVNPIYNDKSNNEQLLLGTKQNNEL